MFMSDLCVISIPYVLCPHIIYVYTGHHVVIDMLRVSMMCVLIRHTERDRVT